MIRIDKSTLPMSVLRVSVLFAPLLAAPSACWAQGVLRGTPLENTPFDPSTYPPIRLPSLPNREQPSTLPVEPDTPRDTRFNFVSRGGGHFRALGNGRWEERNATSVNQFQERGRSRDWVELFDASRGYTLHLHNDALWIIGGNPSVPRFGQWTRIDDGGWRQPGPPPDTRFNFVSRGGGHFRALGNGRWEERNATSVNQFQERGRSRDWVELYDASRGYTLHLHNDALWIIGGNPSVPRFGQWTRIDGGGWR